MSSSASDLTNSETSALFRAIAGWRKVAPDQVNTNLRRMLYE